MHKSGIFLGVFAILLGLGAFYLSARFLDTRHAWLQQIEKGDKTLTTTEATVVKLRQDLALANADYDRVMLQWDTWREPITAQVDAANQSITVNVGPELIKPQQTTEGQPAPTLIYAFQPGANGVYEYVGEFIPTRVAAGSSTLKANWRVRAPDIAGWRAGNNWRLRTRIPQSEKHKFDHLAALFVTQDQLLASRQDDLQRLEQGLTPKIDQLLANREGEIGGFADWEEDRGKLPDEAIDGVLKSLVKEEELRNKALAEATRLRHELLDTIEAYEKFTDINRKATATTTPAAPAAVGQR